MEHKGLSLAPHFAMEIHLHLAATFSREPWTEHFEWLEPLFNERLRIKEGRMHLPDRPGHGFTLSRQARTWTVESSQFGKRP
jgi:L-alanine-DL-glutamate epimerase-like enolase superfamily enzyme